MSTIPAPPPYPSLFRIDQASINSYGKAARAVSENIEATDKAIELGKELIQVITRGSERDAFSLIDRGASLQRVRDYNGNTPLALACLWGRLNIALAIMTKPGVIIDTKNNDGDTPLINASKNFNFTPVVDKLLKMGANVNHKNRFNETALQKACEKHCDEIALLLIIAGAKKEPICMRYISGSHHPDGLHLDEQMDRVRKAMIQAYAVAPAAGGKRAISKTQRKRKGKCRLVVGKRETCCIRPRKGTERRISRKMKRNCCK